MENLDFAGMWFITMWLLIHSFHLDLKNVDFFGLDNRKAQIRAFLEKTREKRQWNPKQNILRGLQLKELERIGRKELRRISAFQTYIFGCSFPPVMEKLGNAGMKFLLTYLFTFPSLLELDDMDIFGLEVHKAETREILKKTQEQRKNNPEHNILQDLWLKEIENEASNEIRRIIAFENNTYGVAL